MVSYAYVASGLPVVTAVSAIGFVVYFWDADACFHGYFSCEVDVAVCSCGAFLVVGCCFLEELLYAFFCEAMVGFHDSALFFVYLKNGA